MLSMLWLLKNVITDMKMSLNGRLTYTYRNLRNVICSLRYNFNVTTKWESRKQFRLFNRYCFSTDNTSMFFFNIFTFHMHTFTFLRV